MSATTIDWNEKAPRPDPEASGLSVVLRIAFAAAAVGCAVALLVSDQSATAMAVADWLGLDSVSQGAKDFLAALTR